MTTIEQHVTITADELAGLEHTIDNLREAALDAQRALAAEDQGWARLDELAEGQALTREDIRKAAKMARVMSLADPLIRRATALSVAYVWGGGCTVSARQEDGDEQDVNEVVQAFYADPSNSATFTSAQAREERERTYRHTGETFHSLFTAPATGRVQVRDIPAHQIVDILTNPEDEVDVWLYKRVWTSRAVQATTAGTTTIASTTRTVYYPDINFRPTRRPRSIDGNDVAWDAPVIHTKVNPTGGRGTPDLLPALSWARGYKGYLEDWARYMKALSRFAWKATARTRAGAASARTAIGARAADSTNQVGQTMITGEGNDLTPALRSGATIDAESGKPLAAMVSAATDVPLTMLLGDPGATGARAVAETLTPAFENPIRARQRLHGELETKVCEYVVREAVRARRLAGTFRIDPLTGRETYALRGDQPVIITAKFPKLSQVDVKVLMEAVATADALEVLPPLLTAQLAMSALEVDDMDDWLEDLADANGNFVNPKTSTAAAAGERAVQAARDGRDLDQPAA